MIDEDAQECDLKYYHVFEDMEKPMSCARLRTLTEEEIKEQFDVIHDLTHRSIVGDSEFAYLDRDKYKEKTDVMV